MVLIEVFSFTTSTSKGSGVLQVHSNSYRAFDSINYAPLATLGVDVDWNPGQLLQVQQHSAADGKQHRVAEPSGPNVN